MQAELAAEAKAYTTAAQRARCPSAGGIKRRINEWQTKPQNRRGSGLGHK